MIVLDARKTTRLSAKQLTTKPRVDRPVLPAELVEVQAEADLSPLGSMLAKNPALLSLVEVFDLVEVTSSRNTYPMMTLLPELPPIKAEPVNPKLRIVANQAFEFNRAYSESEAIIRLAAKSGVSEERAANGLLMMLRQNIMALTLRKTYYLSESTPF